MISQRLPHFAVFWLATAAIWDMVLVFESRVGPLTGVLVFGFQVAVLVAATAVCRARPDATRVRPVGMAACVLVGISSTVLFAAGHASGDVLAFVLLTLYLASALFFAWGWMLTLLLLVGTVIPWLLALPFLVFEVPTIELVSAIFIGSAVSLAIAEGAARSYWATLRHRAREEQSMRELEASRDQAEQARAEAEAATRAKDEFLATLSHELRSPLNAILGWATMLRRGLLGTDEGGRALRIIEESARSQARLIGDLLDLSRIVSGKLSVDLRIIDLGDVIARVLDIVRGAADGNGIRLEVRVAAEPTHVQGDPDRLGQVVENLVSNAIKFTPPGGCVTVALRHLAAHAELMVHDTGIGMGAEMLPKVFERFHQADSSTVRRHGGLGLGLAIARHLVELHGGAIEAESLGPERGSTFRVRLPLAWQAGDRDRPSARGREPGSVGRLPELAHVRVLVVDDERIDREFLTTLLARCGAEVTPAASAQEALAGFRRARPDVVVADLSMPEEDGCALIRKVRMLEDPAARRVPAIAVTALASVEDRRRALAAGFDVHLAKPVEPAEVAAAVARAVGLSC